jgi:death-on-curing protein
MTIVFIDEATALQIHENQIERYGGEASVRDLNLLQSALAMPRATFGGEWLHTFPAGMAAAYLYHLVGNHPYVDGNKRTSGNGACIPGFEWVSTARREVRGV